MRTTGPSIRIGAGSTALVLPAALAASACRRETETPSSGESIARLDEGAADAPAPETPSDQAVAQLLTPWTGDLDGIIERRYVRKGLFAVASYNAGPARIAQLRRKAEAMGLDPNKWFGNVEVVAAREIGAETVQYVSNIYKYYVSYTLIREQMKTRRQAR